MCDVPLGISSRLSRIECPSSLGPKAPELSTWRKQKWQRMLAAGCWRAVKTSSGAGWRRANGERPTGAR